MHLWTFICENKIRTRLSLLPFRVHSVRVWIQESSLILCFCSHFAKWSCWAPPTCCAALWESARDGSSFHFQSSPLCLLLSWRSFRNSCPVFSSPSFSNPRIKPSSKVSEMQCQAHTVCAIWISIFVAKQLASKGFHYKSKSLSVMQLSRLWDVAGCVGGTPPHPLPVCACH